ncbi:MAG: DNA repair protein RecN [Rhodocyclaceae bacterium]|nr:MAG: DNA repair protein RecN [Rhodocyclaceae bacterium]
MLRRLYIRDLVIVDRLELDFAGGFGTLTGETGAGKSILVDALSLALGERADSGVVRNGCERAEVGAEFDAPAAGPLADWLHHNDFDAESGCLLRRVVDSGGRSRAYVNGAPATLAQLREAAEFLADIHGQHAHHSLLRAESQRALLDAHAGLTSLAREVAEKYRSWQKFHLACEHAARDAAATAREREALVWQVKELQALAFEPTQWLEDNQEQRRLSHAASLIEGTESALAALGDGDMAVTLQLEQMLSRLGGLSDYDAELKEPLELLSNAQIQLQEAGHALRHYQRKLDLEPRRLAELENRMAAVLALARKHHVTPEELPQQLVQQTARLDELSLLADAAALAEHEARARQDYADAAAKLSEGRATTAIELSRAIGAAMQQLAMAGGRFEIALERLPEGAAYGLESVEFRVSANAGQPLRPLTKVASGGELSRIGLAVQVIASLATQVPTLIFDEVDVGIGGRVAEIVGRMLHQLGQSRQVLCVTHLPQVAACADWQWSVAKEEHAGSARSRVTPLDNAARIDELARMLGGVKITETTRKHAAEMLGAGDSLG